jgi:HK97 family phage major capsid protein
MKRTILSQIIPHVPTIVMANDGGEDVGVLVAELRKTNDEMQKKMANFDTKGLDQLQEKMDNINGQIDKVEEKNQTLVLELEKEKGKNEEIKEAMDRLEKKLMRLPAGSEEAELHKKELGFLETFAKKGYDAVQSEMSDIERKEYLRSDVNELSGFMMEESFDNMIIKPITEITPMRQLATTKRIDALSEQQYRRDSLVKVYHTGEGEGEFQESTSKYGKLTIPVHSMTMRTEITNRALLGSKFNMESEIMADGREAIAELQGRMFTRGDGQGRPQGFLDANAGVARRSSGTANSFDYDDLILLAGDIKTGYNPVYGFNRKTGAFIRTLKDGSGEYVWKAGNMAAGMPNTINGYSYVEMPDMDDVGADKEPVVFADFRKFYTIVDAFNAIILRNPYKKDGYVIFTMEMFYGGQVVLPEAGRILKCEA